MKKVFFLFCCSSWGVKIRFNPPQVLCADCYVWNLRIDDFIESNILLPIPPTRPIDQLGHHHHRKLFFVFQFAYEFVVVVHPLHWNNIAMKSVILNWLLTLTIKSLQYLGNNPFPRCGGGIYYYTYAGLLLYVCEGLRRIFGNFCLSLFFPR